MNILPKYYADFCIFAPNLQIMQKKHFIGRNLAFFRMAQKLSQPELGELCHMSQSKISRFETDEQSALPEEIEQIAAALGIGAELLTTAAPTFNNENQQGGYAGNYHFHNGAEQLIQAKNEHIITLKKENTAKDEHIKVLNNRIQQLETDCTALRQTLLSFVNLEKGS